jgi:type IV pilus assembly protein PilC
MIKSGIAAPRALKIIAKQTKNKKFQDCVSDVAHQVESGKSLHEALEMYPKIFSHIFVSMIKVGELSGNLEKSLEYLGVQLEREADLKSKTKGAMIYPAVIVGAMVIMGFLMAVFVLPKLTATFKEFGGKLPLMTRIVVGLTDFMSNNSILAAVILFGGTAGIVYYARTESGGRLLDTLILRFPLISPIVKKINLARFARILSSMMKSGIAIVEGLNVSAEALGNSYYREAIGKAAEEVKLGKNITQALEKDERLFPVIVVQMLQVGEETGSLETILQQLAEHYEAEIDSTMRNISSIIEPILLLVIGAVVGVLALALISPIYNLSQNIG